jgi:hypothetical protein
VRVSAKSRKSPPARTGRVQDFCDQRRCSPDCQSNSFPAVGGGSCFAFIAKDFRLRKTLIPGRNFIAWLVLQ